MKIKLIPITTIEQKNDSINNLDKTLSNKLALTYEFQEDNYKSEEILNIKKFLANYFNSSIEKFYIDNHPTENLNISNLEKEKEKHFDYGLADNLNVIEILEKSKKNNFVKNLKNIFGENLPCLYYKEHINYEYISLELDYNMNNINKIKMEVYSTCSIYILKELIKEKEELKLEKKSEIILMNNDSTLNDDEIISEVYKEFLNKKNLENKNESTEGRSCNSVVQSVSNSNNNLENDLDFIKKPLKLKIIKKGLKKFSIGINLNFNSLKNINKINYSDIAPKHREAKDGLNFLCYCRNEDCEINDEMFVVNKGNNNQINFLFKFP